MAEVFIRRPQPLELHSVRALAQTVVDEIYGGIWAPPPLSVEKEGWQQSWIAAADEKILGVVLTNEEWLDDLWVLPEARGRGFGQRLLAQAESEIVACG